ncbi:MAG: hypothetical protein GY813_03435, partial [Halieaceae bacterium]|nr:hypothetical protein [Halieaceae bacterium]
MTSQPNPAASTSLRDAGLPEVPVREMEPGDGAGEAAHQQRTQLQEHQAMDQQEFMERLFPSPSQQSRTAVQQQPYLQHQPPDGVQQHTQHQNVILMSNNGNHPSPADQSGTRPIHDQLSKSGTSRHRSLHQPRAATPPPNRLLATQPNIRSERALGTIDEMLDGIVCPASSFPNVSGGGQCQDTANKQETDIHQLSTEREQEAKQATEQQQSRKTARKTNTRSLAPISSTLTTKGEAMAYIQRL